MKKILSTIVLVVVLAVNASATNFLVTNLTTDNWTAPQPAGSFAQAILDLHAGGAGPHKIIFQVAGTIPMGNPANYYINATVTGGVILDGYTAVPGYVAGSPKIFLDGPGYNTFPIAASGVTFRGLGVYDQTFVVTGTGFKMFDCWVGLDAAGAVAGGVGTGGWFFDLQSAHNSVIGFATNGYRNVFAGHGSINSPLSITTSNSVSVAGNFFGCTSDGTTLSAYFAASALILKGGTSNRVDSNVIGGSVIDKAGIEIFSGANASLLIRNNKIGINSVGTYMTGGVITTNQGNKGHGIMFSGGSAANAQITDNVISSNGQAGIYVTIANTGYVIMNNIIGLPGSGIQGAQNYGNGFGGIVIKGASTSNILINNNTVCKSGWRSASPSYQDETVGIIITGGSVPAAATVTISNNYVGIDRSFNLAGNTFTGIYLFNVGNMSGGVKANVQITGNVTGDNGETPALAVLNSHGIAVYNSSAFTVTSNYIGVGTGGQNIGNSANGIELNTTSNFTFSSNQVAYNKGRRNPGEAEACGGVMIFASTNGYLQNNNIFSNTNSGGSYSLSNHGVVVQQGGQVMIGGTGASQPNNIIANGTHGIFVFDGANNVQMTRNIISCNTSMGISLNVVGDPNTVGAKGVGNTSMTTGPTLILAGCPGGGTAGSGNASGVSPGTNSTVEVFGTPACKTCPNVLRGEAQNYQQTVFAAGTAWSATGVTGNVSVTATNTVGSAPFFPTSRFSDCQTCSLPIKLLYFNGKRLTNENVLFWATTYEKDNAAFIIERSEDGKNFSAIGKVNGAEESNTTLKYSYTDHYSSQSVVYYRLRQVDIDGAESFSNVIALSIEANISLTVFPNPTNGIVSIALNDQELGGNGSVSVYNTLGQEVYSQIIDATELSSGISVDFSNLAHGTYVVKVLTSQGEWVERLMKE